MKKNKLIIAAISALIFMGCCSTSFAGNRPGAVTGTLSEAFYYFSSQRHVANTSMPNVAVAYDFDHHWAVEGGVGFLNTNYYRNFIPPNGDNAQGIHGYSFSADGIYRFDAHGRFQPYALGGLGVLSIRPNGFDSEHQGNINAGVGAQYFIDNSIALRVDARDLYSLRGGKNDLMVNFGVSFLFGGNKA